MCALVRAEDLGHITRRLSAYSFSGAYDVFSQASRATTAGRRHRQLAFNTLGFSKLTVYSLVDSLPFMALIGGQLLDSAGQQIYKRIKRKDLCLNGRQR